jgi:hypothetical protein
MEADLSEVRAVDLRAQLEEPTDPRGGVRITGALIEGQLDLAAFSLGFPLEFERCTFTDLVSLKRADLHSVALTDCTLPGILANGHRPPANGQPPTANGQRPAGEARRRPHGLGYRRIPLRQHGGPP